MIASCSFPRLCLLFNAFNQTFEGHGTSGADAKVDDGAVMMCFCVLQFMCCMKHFITVVA